MNSEKRRKERLQQHRYHGSVVIFQVVLSTFTRLIFTLPKSMSGSPRNNRKLGILKPLQRVFVNLPQLGEHLV